jgi:hypothetical protein
MLQERENICKNIGENENFREDFRENEQKLFAKTNKNFSRKLSRANFRFFSLFAKIKKGGFVSTLGTAWHGMASQFSCFVLGWYCSMVLWFNQPFTSQTNSPQHRKNLTEPIKPKKCIDCQNQILYALWRFRSDYNLILYFGLFFTLWAILIITKNANLKISFKS